MFCFVNYRLVTRILKNAPTESNEAQIFPDGTFEYLQNGVKINNPNISEGNVVAADYHYFH